MISPSFGRLVVPCLLCLAMLSGPAYADGLEDAGKFYKAGQYDTAMKQVDAWLTSHPGDARGRFLKGLILVGEKKPEEAIKVFRKLTEDYPEKPAPYNNLAVIYASQGRYTMARDELESAIAAYPGYAAAHENLGDIYARLAQQAYEKAIQLGESDARLKEKVELTGHILAKKRQP